MVPSVPSDVVEAASVAACGGNDGNASGVVSAADVCILCGVAGEALAVLWGSNPVAAVDAAVKVVVDTTLSTEVVVVAVVQLLS